MVQTLEAIRGGGGSIRVGTVGTVASLMTRELDSAGSKLKAASSSQCKPSTVRDCHGFSVSKNRTSPLEEASSSNSNIKHRSPENSRIRTRVQNENRVPISSAATPRRYKQKTSPEQASSISRDRNMKTVRRSPENHPRKSRTHTRSHQIPILGAENMVLERTPSRETSSKKGVNIVDIVDMNCGSPRSSLSNRLKKLGFSKLSQSMM